MTKYLLIHSIGLCGIKENVYLLSGIFSVLRQEAEFGKLITQFM